jgi:membrane-associated protein
VAGVSEMSRSKFTFYDVTGGTLWVVGVTLAGYFFGGIPFVKTHLDKIIWSMILLPGLVIMYGAWRARRSVQAA